MVSMYTVTCRLNVPTHKPPPPPPPPRKVACVANVSARVCRESWDESKEEEMRLGRREEEIGEFLLPPPASLFKFIFFGSHSNFRAITRWKRLLRRLPPSYKSSYLSKKYIRFFKTWRIKKMMYFIHIVVLISFILVSKYILFLKWDI